MPYKDRAKQLAYMRAWGLENRKTAEKRQWRVDNPERMRDRRRGEREMRRIHTVVARAVARGVLVREPCLFCGVEPGEAHHHDYSQPLVVTWLCRRHHALVHRNNDVTNVGGVSSHSAADREHGRLRMAAEPSPPRSAAAFFPCWAPASVRRAEMPAATAGAQGELR